MTTLHELAERGAALKRQIALAPDDADAVRLRAELDAVAAEIETSWTAQDVISEPAKDEDLGDGLIKLLVVGTNGSVAIGPHFGHRLIAHYASRKGH